MKDTEYAVEEILDRATMDFSKIDKIFAERLKWKFLEAAESYQTFRRLSDDELEQAAAAGTSTWPELRRSEAHDIGTEEKKK